MSPVVILGGSSSTVVKTEPSQAEENGPHIDFYETREKEATSVSKIHRKRGLLDDTTAVSPKLVKIGFEE